MKVRAERKEIADMDRNCLEWLAVVEMRGVKDR